MITNADITIFNSRTDKSSRREVFDPVFIPGVSYYCSNSSSGSQGEKKEVIKYKIRIPVSADIKKTYICESEYKKLADDKRKDFWTIQKGSIIILGKYNGASDQEIAFTDIKALGVDTITVVEYADNTIRGSDRVKHWRIGGA